MGMGYGHDDRDCGSSGDRELFRQMGSMSHLGTMHHLEVLARLDKIIELLTEMQKGPAELLKWIREQEAKTAKPSKTQDAE